MTFNTTNILDDLLLCCCPCEIFSDEFERTDSTNLGSSWDERSGDWQIKDNTLYESGTANALVICTTPNPKGERSTVTLTMTPQGGEKYRIILNYLNDANFQYVEVECGTSEFTLTAGGETRVYTGTVDGETEWTMHGAVNDGHLWVYFTDLFENNFCVWDNTVTLIAGGDKAGVGNGGTTEIKVDTFFFYQHGQDNAKCVDPGCWCDTVSGGRHYVAWKIRLDWYSDDYCGPIGGSWAALEYNCQYSRWDAVDGAHAGVAAALGDGTLPTTGGYGDLPQVICGLSDRCDWYLFQGDGTDGYCCTTYITTGCPSGIACQEDSATYITCSAAWEARWDAVVTNADFTCPLCGGCYPPPAGDDAPCAGSYWVIATENV